MPQPGARRVLEQRELSRQLRNRTRSQKRSVVLPRILAYGKQNANNNYAIETDEVRTFAFSEMYDIEYLRSQLPGMAFVDGVGGRGESIDEGEGVVQKRVSTKPRPLSYFEDLKVNSASGPTHTHAAHALAWHKA